MKIYEARNFVRPPAQLRQTQFCESENGGWEQKKEPGADTDIFKIPFHLLCETFRSQGHSLQGLAFVIANFRKHTDRRAHAHIRRMATQARC